MLLLGTFGTMSAQNQTLIDGVVGVVGNEPILKSDIENQLLQYKARKISLPGDDRCYIFEELLFQTLLLNQAEVDSVYAEDSQVESELTRRLDFFEEQMGGRKKMEDYFGKPYPAIKEYFRDMVKDQIVIQQMQSNISSGLRVSPAEVKAFYKRIPKDSLPIIESEIHFSQIVIYPKIYPEQIEKIKSDLNDIKKRVENNSSSFEIMATLYSEDEVANEKGGSLGWVRRGDLVPEFAEVAFGMETPGQLSEVIETEFGFHLIKFQERRGEQILVSHILMRPKVRSSEKLRAKQTLDSIAQLIRTDKITFTDAAAKYTQDEAGMRNGGIVLNPYSGTSTFESSHLDAATNFIIQKLKIGEVSSPFESQTQKGKTEIKIIVVTQKTQPHVASLETDYQKISDMTLAEKKEKTMDEWIREKQKTTYIKLSPEFRTCKFKYEGWLEQ